MKRQIMKGLAALCAGVMTLCATSFFSSCERLDVLDGQVEELQGDIKDLQGQIDALDARLKAVEALKAQLEALGARITALEAVELAFQESSTTHELQYSLDGGKTWTGTGIILAKVPELDFQVTANNELQVKYGNSGWETITTLAKNCEKNVTLRVNPDTNELEIAMDGTTYVGTGIILAENCDNEFKFQVNPDTKEVEFSFDGGKTWIPTGDKCVDPCAKPEVKFEETDEAITVWVGEESFVIAKPQQIEFEIKSGKLQMDVNSTVKIAVLTKGIDDLTVISAPKGWFAEIDADGLLVITAPAAEDLPAEEGGGGWGPLATRAAGDAARSGLVKIHACGADGACMVGKLSVEAFVNPYAGTEWESYFAACKITAADGMYMINFDGLYGISTIDTYKQDIQAVIDHFANTDPMSEEYYEFPADYTYSMDEMEAIPGVEAGKEYVIWAIPQEVMYSACVFENFYLKFYTHISVDVKAESTSAYDVQVNVDIKGAKAYYALPIANPEIFTEAEDGYDYNQLEEMKQTLLTEFTRGMVQNSKMYTESYVGSLAKMGGFEIQPAPNSEIYLLLLVVDDRSASEYSVADVKEYKFTTNNITEGSPITVEIVQDEEKTTYSSIFANINTSSEDWSCIYYDWMDEDEFNSYDDDAAIVDAIIAKGYQCSRLKDEYYLNEFEERGFNAGQTVYLVSFVVDNNDQYSAVAFEEVSTKAIEWSTETFSVETATVDKLNLTLTLSENVTKFKAYNVRKNSMYSDYSDLTAVAQGLFIGSDYPWNYGKLYEGNQYTVENYYAADYLLFILPYDADDKPAGKAILYEYTCTK